MPHLRRVIENVRVRSVKASEASECSVCGKHPLRSGVGGGPALTFFRVTTERVVVNRRAAEQTMGLDMYFGGGHPALAELFSPNPHVYDTPDELRAVLIVCDNCAATHPVLELLEMAGRRREVES